MAITLAQILNAIENTLGAAVGMARSESYDELTEGIHDLPLIQVYPESGAQDPAGTTDRTTFRGGVRQTDLVINVDLYAQQRAHIGEDMSKLVDMIDAMQDIFEAQDIKPFFGLAGIQAFSWSWQRVVFQYGDPLRHYIGARFRLTIKVF